MAKELSCIAQKYNLELETCAEKIELESLGIKHSSCIDGNLIKRILGNDIRYSTKSKLIFDNNREACGCVKCIDIGEYDTCVHNCLYCYANLNKDRANLRFNTHNNKSPILVGEYEEAIVKERGKKDTKSFRVIREEIEQQRLF